MLIPNTVCVIGRHHSGKTTAVEQLIQYIKSQGLTVSSIKDIHQVNWTMERVGSNSHRHLQASGSYVFARGFDETHLIWNRQLSFKEMLAHIDTDWLIIEGMSELPFPKIIAAKTIEDIDNLWTDNVIAITGEISEKQDTYRDVPCINALTDINRLGALLLEKAFSSVPPSLQSIKIYIDNKEIPLNNWVTTLYTDVIKSLCQNLRGYKEGAEIKIQVLGDRKG